MEIQPVNRYGLPEIISNRLLSQILSGELKPSDKLPSEHALCEGFHVSRSALREAIAALIARGVLERRNNGVFVKNTDVSDVYSSMNLFFTTNNIPISAVIEARQMVEIESAALAAQRATPEELSAMQRCISQMNAPSASEEDVVNCATDFHKMIATSTHNPIIEAFYQVILEYLYQDDRASSVVKESAKQHDRIYCLIEKGDAEGARLEMKKHLSNVKENFFHPAAK